MIGVYSSWGRRFSRAEEEEAIRSVILASIETFNRHDAKAGTGFFTADADFVNVFGRWSYVKIGVKQGPQARSDCMSGSVSCLQRRDRQERETEIRRAPKATKLSSQRLLRTHDRILKCSDEPFTLLL